MKRCVRHDPPRKKARVIHFKAEKYLHKLGSSKNIDARLDRTFKGLQA
jgi:hypothetical protein